MNEIRRSDPEVLNLEGMDSSEVGKLKNNVLKPLAEHLGIIWSDFKNKKERSAAIFEKFQKLKY